MTLAKIIDTLKMIALKHPNVNSVYEGNIYDILNAKPDNKYASVVITQQSHTTDETYDHYGFVIFYVDRLIDDLEENRVQIQSIGKSMLGNIITAFCNEFEAECDNIIYQPFTQRFTDETAGVYCTITIDIIKDAYCAERYWDESWSAPIISIKNVDMSITLTENGHYVLDYDPTTYTGIGKVDIDVELNTEPYYNDGYEDGYNQGYAEGEQVSYDKGYEQGQTDIAANARVLEVTENGIYMSKFSDPIVPPLVTGMYDDGSGFYSYATVSGSAFDTGIPATQDSKIEFWWKNDATNRVYAAIIGGQTYEGYIFKFAEFSTNTYRIEYGNYKVGKLFEHNFTYDMTSQWNHIIFSKKDGLYVNGELICSVQGEEWAKDEVVPNFWINAAYLEEKTNNANGTFGMIKINDITIIPTSDGFLNVNTGKLLETVQNGDYAYTENLPKYGEGELYKTINVNVAPKINVYECGLKFAYSSFNAIPEFFDFKNVEDMYRMFQSCTNLAEVRMIDTSSVTNMSNCFYSCSNLKQIATLDTSNVTNMEAMCNYCGQLITFPPLNTSKVTNMREMFRNCNNLVSVPPLDARSVVKQSYGLFGSNTFNNLTDFGGLIGLKASIDGNYGFEKCPNLTYESCINILNGLYDFTGNGITPDSNQGKLKVHQNFLDTVGEEIIIATNKGWIITA